MTNGYFDLRRRFSYTGSLRQEFVGNIVMSGNRITGLPYAVGDDEPVTKAQLTDIGGYAVKQGKIKLRANGKASVRFGAAAGAVATGTVAHSTGYDFSTNNTFIYNPNGAGAVTVTFASAAGTSVSGSSPSTDISGGVDDSFKIAVDADAFGTPSYETIQLTLTGLNSGANIAAAMQAAIRAVGGAYAAVTVAYTTVYTITSGTKGTGSKVLIGRADAGNLTEELKLGPDGGTETTGTGDMANAALTQMAEVIAKINTGQALVVASESADHKLVLTTAATGLNASIVMGNGTTNTALGFTNTAAYYGPQGLGYDYNMADALYCVQATITATAQASMATKNLSITNLATTGFDVECEGTSAEDYVFVTAIGTGASS